MDFIFIVFALAIFVLIEGVSNLGKAGKMNNSRVIVCDDGLDVIGYRKGFFGPKWLDKNFPLNQIKDISSNTYYMIVATKNKKYKMIMGSRQDAEECVRLVKSL